MYVNIQHFWHTIIRHVFADQIARIIYSAVIYTATLTPAIWGIYHKWRHIIVVVKLMSGHRTCAGYEYYGERVSSTPSLHHSKSQHQILDSKNLIVIYGQRNDGIEPTATVASLMRSGVRIPIPSECSMQGTDSNYSTWTAGTHSSCSSL